jgi:hypothetical protein
MYRPVLRRMVTVRFNNKLIAYVNTNRASAKLVIIDDHPRWTMVHFKLSAHLLDLRSLLFELRRKNSHIFLEFADRGFLLCSIGF